ncbi:MAG: hypothetical protein J6S59_06960 [Clostridia bacterium]|nr:hypothetical protein [Clostridia bacterium]
MNPKRVTLFAGHYGSGKSNIAVNYALKLAGEGYPVRLADLDIVNPYFRSKDSETGLRAAGVEVISSEFANTNVDVPVIPAEAYAMTDDRAAYFVADVGGDDQGARALGRFAEQVVAEGNYEMFLVINCYRPMTRTAEDVLVMQREIEAASKIPFTAIVNNSNLGVATTAETVLDSVKFAEDCARLTGLPLKMTAAWEDVVPELSGKIENLLSMKLSNLQIW